MHDGALFCGIRHEKTGAASNFPLFIDDFVRTQTYFYPPPPYFPSDRIFVFVGLPHLTFLISKTSASPSQQEIFLVSQASVAPRRRLPLGTRIEERPRGLSAG